MKWYAFFVKTGEEDTICRYLNQILSYYTEIDYNILVPKRELIEYKLGKKTLVQKILFPGYVLVYTESILSIYNVILIVGWHSDLFALLRIEENFQEIRSEEIVPIINLVSNEGIINISTIFLEKDKVIITDGPLAHYKGTIKKINPRKGRAKISLKFLNQNCYFDISVKCLEKVNEEDIKNKILF